MAYFEYKGKKVFYEEFGEGTPLLLLHGNIASSKIFEQIIPEYKDTYRVVVMDFVGYGQSDRVEKLDEDLWFDQAMQVIHFLREKDYRDVNIIGTSGGALVAINVALEAPELVNKIIADSFQGERANKEDIGIFEKSREMTKYFDGAASFYEAMNGADWEQVNDADTKAVVTHAKTITEYFHKPISEIESEVLFVGSEQDVFFPSGYYEKVFTEAICKMKRAKKHIFKEGMYPAMISNQNEFVVMSNEFMENK